MSLLPKFLLLLVCCFVVNGQAQDVIDPTFIKLDPCSLVRCRSGTHCIDGNCIDDNIHKPCRHGSPCPPGQRCVNNFCEKSYYEGWPCSNIVCIRAPCPPNDCPYQPMICFNGHCHY